jgi:2-amino-4-hydroxy-6-hydroxymethyldihydropteridine diphosphokinase
LTTAYVGLGANLGEREVTLGRALELLGEHVEVTGVSTFRDTEPVGYTDQPRFLNAAARIETELAPGDLLDVLLAVERELGRVRVGAPRFGPRTIDLDLLLYGDEAIDEPGLTVPHPRLHERVFVLEPLAELDPELVVPGRGTVSALLTELDE